MDGDVLARTTVAGTVDLALVDAIHEALEALWSAVPQVGDEDRMLFALAVSEVATNVIEHGEFAPGADRPALHVVLEVDRTALTATITDTADPALIRLDEVTMPGDDAESGRGLALALAALDDLVHEPGEGNVWRLRRHRRDPLPD